MFALIQILLSLALMILLLNRRIHISYAVLAATAVLFVLSGFVPAHLGQALYTTAVSFTTWNMVLTLYLVMCLEYLLRTSGILKNFTLAASSLIALFWQLCRPFWAFCHLWAALFSPHQW